ncbi:alpha/beta hydrolase family protein [Mycobacterium sp. SMC-4]|uniref:alpha/beta hydrolase family protein n=1 Tax=Mycobacterium sp. SMC-4 TaxID=2857059 RepID=UPI0021B39F01|nr:alpha/beta hydrolase family protein [Mycobacterium sp. SMC-4]UXA16157.1 alpha/beta hydrolase family protein [Mycobacterium sp. SMC-4]
MSRPTVAQARAWDPEALSRLAASWDDAARRLVADTESAAGAVERSREHWTGAAADAARRQADRVAADAARAARVLIAASVAALDGAEQIAVARRQVLALVDAAARDGLPVSDNGTVLADSDPQPLLTMLAGGDPSAAAEMLRSRARRLSVDIGDALRRLGDADLDTAADIAAAFATASAPASGPASTVPAGAWTASQVVDAWPRMGQDRIAAQVAAMTPQQRDQLVAEFPGQVGNTDGVPWTMRSRANRVNLAAAILSEDGRDEGSRRRLAVYRDLLGEVDDPAGAGGRIQRQIIAFDPERASLVELNGDLSTARAVAVLVPGVNTTMDGSAANTATARRFVSGSRGEVAMITYLGGPFPQVDDPTDVWRHAADPRYALDMAPRLVAFSEDVERTVAPGIPVTVIGHSYGGSIVGTAETLGLTSDRTLFLAAAGAGVGVDDPSDWRNRNPDVLRYSMTAPGDFIELVQGIRGGPHGADPDTMPGVTVLGTGRYDDGGPVAGWGAHSGMLNRPSDAWRTILAVIAGDS